MIYALNRTDNYTGGFEDETIPDKAIVLKMPERKMKTYFIPLPVDLDVRPCKSLISGTEAEDNRAIRANGRGGRFQSIRV